MQPWLLGPRLSSPGQSSGSRRFAVLTAVEHSQMRRFKVCDVGQRVRFHGCRAPTGTASRGAPRPPARGVQLRPPVPDIPQRQLLS